METVYRIFMYIFPYAASVALYAWMFRRAQRVPHKTFKAVSLATVVAGFCYTVYSIVKTIGTVFTDDSFHFQIMVVTVAVLFFAAIFMAFGEPEK